MLDGANAVSGEPRHFGAAWLSSSLALTAMVLGLWLWRTRFRLLLVWAAMAAAVPGAWYVLWVRADAPLQRDELSSTVTHAVRQVQRVAPWPDGGVEVVFEEDDVLYPIGRYALPTRPAVAEPKVRLWLQGSSLRASCVADAGVVVCGASR